MYLFDKSVHTGYTLAYIHMVALCIDLKGYILVTALVPLLYTLLADMYIIYNIEGICIGKYLSIIIILKRG